MNRNAEPNSMGVSVIIPAFRAVNTIGRAIDSVLAQTLSASEILVVDDGSPDDIASALAAYGDRVKLIKKANGGAASARNLGIERATGDLIAFLDADDYWAPLKVERQLDVFLRHPEVGLVAGRYSRQSPDGRAEAGADGDPFDLVLQLRGEAAFRAATRIWTGTVMVRRELLSSMRFDCELSTAEDRDLWVRLAVKAPIYLLSEPLATAVLEPGSLSRTKLARDCSNMLRVVRRNRGLLGFASARMWESHTLYRWGACEVDPATALAKLLHSWLLWPLPYERELVAKPLARAQAFAVNVLRLLKWRRDVRPQEQQIALVSDGPMQTPTLG